MASSSSEPAPIAAHETRREPVSSIFPRWNLAPALLQFPRSATAPIEEAPATEWERALRIVQRAGFDTVDLTDTWLRIGDLPPARLAELRSVLDHVGLRATSVSLVRRSVIDAEEGEANVDYTLRVLDATAALGGSVVSIGLHQALTDEQNAALWFWTQPGHVDPPDVRVRTTAAERIRSLGVRAQDLGLEISLEMYEDTYLGTGDSSVALLAEIDHPAVGLNPDIGNLVRAHHPIENWEDVLIKTMPHTNFWHVKNYFRMEDPSHGVVMTSPAPLEQGLINYRRALEIARASGFAGHIVVEHYGGDGLSVSRTNADYLTRLMHEMEE